MWQPGDPAERIPFSMTVLKSSAMSEGAATANLMLQRLQSALTHEIKKMTSIKRAQGELGLGRARKVGLGEPPPAWLSFQHRLWKTQLSVARPMRRS